MSEELTAKLNDLREKLNEVQQNLRLSEQAQEFDQVNTDTQQAAQQLSDLRQKGYQFGAGWQQTLEQDLPQRWRAMEPSVRDAIRDESARLEAESKRAHWQMATAEKYGADVKPAEVEAAEKEVEELADKVDEAARAIERRYEPLQRELNAIERGLRGLDWVFEQRDEASFAFLNDEALVNAVKAEWVKTGKGRKDPDGVLFLTDKRLIFEQKETTGKTLGLFGGKKEQEAELILDVANITDVAHEDKGMLGGKDMLHLKASAGPETDITLELKGGADNEYWAQLLQQVADGSIASDRVD
jgi:hypothetical protein